MNYDDAKENCYNKGAKLFEPKNIYENEFIMNLTQKNDLNAYWIGIHKGLNGLSVYSSDNSTLTWSHFDALAKPEEQNNVCALVSFDDGVAAWKDQDCSLKKHSVCDTHIGKSSFHVS